MAIISMFYGIIVSMYFLDTDRHHRPHIHVKYQGQEAIVSIVDGKVLGGSLPPPKRKLVAAWIEIHKEDLMADWELASKGEKVFPIEPLK
ncbi:MAG: DUF4160 domain-containing protein [Candidatus Sumerlaeota bacterium]|nr:DUF4160 domain-containing protein [Candidatus Sumerlaeota bacterium]